MAEKVAGQFDEVHGFPGELTASYHRDPAANVHELQLRTQNRKLDANERVIRYSWKVNCNNRAWEGRI